MNFSFKSSGLYLFFCYLLIGFLYVECGKDDKNELVYKTKTDSQTQKITQVAKRERWGRGDELGIWD